MSDARISTGLPSHPKTKKLMRRLGAAGPWALVCLFLWARNNRSDGDLCGMTDEDIELASDWAGDDGALVAALVLVGFLDGDESSRTIHDWASHQPWSAGADARSQSSKWAALCKRYGRDEAAQRMPEYANRVRPVCDPHAELCDPHAAPTDPQCPASASASASESKEQKPKATPPAAPDGGVVESSQRFTFKPPGWVPADAWAAFVDMRRKIRAPLTNHAAKLAVDELDALRGNGTDPAAVLNQSVMNSWRGLFAVKSKVVQLQIAADPEPIKASHRPLTHGR